jgi:hypothetical protein
MESGILKTLFAEPTIIAAPAGHTIFSGLIARNRNAIINSKPNPSLDNLHFS